MIRDLAYFKDKFITGYEITEDDIQDWLDSFRHVNVPVPLGDTTGLDAILANYRLKSVTIALNEIDGLGDYLGNILADYITTGSPIAMSQVTGLIDYINDRTGRRPGDGYHRTFVIAEGEGGLHFNNDDFHAITITAVGVAKPNEEGITWYRLGIVQDKDAGVLTTQNYTEGEANDGYQFFIIGTWD